MDTGNGVPEQRAERPGAAVPGGCTLDVTDRRPAALARVHLPDPLWSEP